MANRNDLVDEAKLKRTLARVGLTETDLCELMGVPRASFLVKCAVSPKGWRETVERALYLEPGALRLSVSDDEERAALGLLRRRHAEEKAKRAARNAAR